MLNERAEFEAYITNPESSSPRIQPKLLTGNFSTDCGLYGIEQILVVLARGYILTLTVKMKFIQMGLFALNF